MEAGLSWEANEDEDDEDKVDEEMNRKPKRFKLIDVQIPKNIKRSPMVTAAMDRTNSTLAEAMHLLSAMLRPPRRTIERPWSTRLC